MKPLPIGIDDFEKVRRGGYYYVDKTLMIRDFLEMRDEVALIARPRRFGKTLNMTMLRDFFDITKDSLGLFRGLAIMDTEYGKQINSRPVIYFTFKNCKGASVEELSIQLKLALQEEYSRYYEVFACAADQTAFGVIRFRKTYENLMDQNASYLHLSSALLDLTRAVYEHYGKKPILLIDEYDQPIMSSYEFGYHKEVGTFFSNFYGAGLKGNVFLDQALLTGVQRVAKESIFSQFNNPQVYTVADSQYALYFGLGEEETRELLAYYGLSLNAQVREMYDGYCIGGFHLYNPWSIMNYIKRGRLDNYWVNSSANFLVREALKKADRSFWSVFDKLTEGKEEMVWITLDTSFVERESNYSLWGLLVNAGYLTVQRFLDSRTAIVKIPNGEVMAEFQVLVSEIAGIDGMDLRQMFDALLKKDMERFLKIYREIVISCTSYMDAKENAYHMLFLGMCITLKGLYRVTSNLESGYGRSDVMLEAQKAGYPHVVIEFKQGKDLEKLKKEALRQILDQKYYAKLRGQVICIGIAHDKKRCEMEHLLVEN